MEKKETGKRMKRWRRTFAGAFMAVAVSGISLLLGGCQIPFLSMLSENSSYIFRVGNEECPEAEAKIILLNFQKEYSSLYGIDMWDHDYGDAGGLEEYVKDLTVSQLAEVYTLDVIAGELEMALSEEEQQNALKAAEAYYSGLSSAEQEYLGAGEDEVESLYERYILARKLYSELKQEVSQEVSDDEACVMEMQQICVSDRTSAEDILEQLSSGTEFSGLASSYSEAETLDLYVTRTTFSAEITEALFALDTGEYSGVLEMEGAYYIFYCVNPFNSELTEQNKENVLEQRMEDAVSSAYAMYAASLDSSLDEENWSQIKVDTSLELSGASFLEVYDSLFGDEE